MKNFTYTLVSIVIAFSTIAFSSTSKIPSSVEEYRTTFAKPRVGQFVLLKGLRIENGISLKAHKLVKVSAFDNKTKRFYVHNKTTLEDGRIFDESYHQSINQLEDYYRTLSAIEGLCGNIGGFNEVIEGPGQTSLSTCHFQRNTESGTVFSWFSSKIPLGIVKLEEIDKIKKTELYLQIADFKW